MKTLTIILPEELRNTFKKATAVYVVPSSKAEIESFTDAGNAVCQGLLALSCWSARNKDPATGVIGVQKGPFLRGMGP